MCNNLKWGPWGGDVTRDGDVFFVLDKHAELDVHSASSLHNSTRVNMSSHWKTLLVDVLIWAHTLLIPWNIFNCLVTLGIIIARDDHA
jgi:hypothetical protein